MVVQSVQDIALQVQFDLWFAEKGFVVHTTSASRKGKTINWNSRKSAQCWKFFEQGALEMDGRPVVKCLICNAIYKHGGLFGPSAMSAHLTQEVHLNQARLLVYGNMEESPIPSEEQILARLKSNGNVGIEVSRNNIIVFI